MDSPRITLLKRAFRSGSSEFWRARLTGAGGFSRPILVKRLAPEVAGEPRLVERERAEALLTGRLVHPNVLAVLDYCIVDGQAVTVLEDVRAVELLHLLERATQARRRLAPRLALGIAWSVLNALVHAHTRPDPSLGIAGIAHGDLSPSNILIETTGRVLLRDFGIPLQALPTPAAVAPAAASASPGATGATLVSLAAASAPSAPEAPAPEPIARLGRLHGKPGYMSPELVTRGVITPRSDVFAVGILLYELITFRRLFGGRDGAETLKAVAVAQVDEKIARYAGDLPMPLRELMRRALKRQPDERFASAADMLRALEAFFPGNPHEVAPELAHLVLEIAAPEDEAAAADTPAARKRSGKRKPSHMILPAADDPEFEAEFDASEHWSNNTPPPQVDFETLLADIEPVGPPPLPPDALTSMLRAASAVAGEPQPTRPRTSQSARPKPAPPPEPAAAATPGIAPAPAPTIAAGPEPTRAPAEAPPASKDEPVADAARATASTHAPEPDPAPAHASLHAADPQPAPAHASLHAADPYPAPAHASHASLHAADPHPVPAHASSHGPDPVIAAIEAPIVVAPPAALEPLGAAPAPDRFSAPAPALEPIAAAAPAPEPAPIAEATHTPEPARAPSAETPPLETSSLAAAPAPAPIAETPPPSEPPPVVPAPTLPPPARKPRRTTLSNFDALPEPPSIETFASGTPVTAPTPIEPPPPPPEPLRPRSPLASQDRQAVTQLFSEDRGEERTGIIPAMPDDDEPAPPPPRAPDPRAEERTGIIPAMPDDDEPAPRKPAGFEPPPLPPPLPK